MLQNKLSDLNHHLYFQEGLELTQATYKGKVVDNVNHESEPPAQKYSNNDKTKVNGGEGEFVGGGGVR